MKVLLADDHMLFRDGLKLVLNKFDPDIQVIEADTYEAALEAVDREGQVDLILLDLKMPGMNGFDGLDGMRAVAEKTPVVIVSGAFSQKDISSSFDHGAEGFIPKTLGSRAMFSAINLVLSGEKYVPSIAYFDKLESGADQRRRPTGVVGDGVFPDLTPREHDVLGLLVEGLSNQKIADQLGIREVTVRARLTAIFRKIGVTSRTQAVGLAIRKGFAD